MLIHRFHSGIADGGDTSLVQPSNWNDVLKGSVSRFSANSTLAPTDGMCLATGTITLTLAPTYDGQLHFVKNIGTGVVTISGNIDGDSSYQLVNKYQRVLLVWGATEALWHVVSAN